MGLYLYIDDTDATPDTPTLYEAVSALPGLAPHPEDDRAWLGGGGLIERVGEGAPQRIRIRLPTGDDPEVDVALEAWAGFAWHRGAHLHLGDGQPIAPGDAQPLLDALARARAARRRLFG